MGVPEDLSHKNKKLSEPLYLKKQQQEKPSDNHHNHHFTHCCYKAEYHHWLITDKAKNITSDSKMGQK